MALIIPDSVNAASAGPRVAFAMAKSKFAAAAKEYQDKGGKAVPSRLRVLEECFERVETTFMATLKDHPEREKIGKCVAAMVRFGAVVTQLERQGVPSFHPATRSTVYKVFKDWEAAEKDYAEMGFKTVSARDIFLSLMPLGAAPKIHPPIYTFLMIERAADEQPVFHAARFAEQYPKEMAAAAEDAQKEAEAATEAASAETANTPAS